VAGLFSGLDVMTGNARANYPMVPDRSFLGRSSVIHWCHIDAVTATPRQGTRPCMWARNRSLESCDTNLAIMSGRPIGCCRASRAMFRV
jgi:hypothetical protein